VTVHVHVAQAEADSGVLCDRGYMTATEWRTEGGGFKDRSGGGFKRLPFHCCAIAFTPFEDPVPPRPVAARARPLRKQSRRAGAGGAGRRAPADC